MNVSLMQLRRDFRYLKHNLSVHTINEDLSVNSEEKGLLKDILSLKESIFLCIKNIVSCAVDSVEKTDNIKFLKNDKRAIQILKRYNIVIE